MCYFTVLVVYGVSAMRKAPNDISQAKMVDLITSETLYV